MNISSAAARLGAANERVDYAATKGAVEAMTVGLAREAGAEGVRVNAVRPGLIDTEIHARGGQAGRAEALGAQTPLGRAGTAAEVAEAVVWLLVGAILLRHRRDPRCHRRSLKARVRLALGAGRCCLHGATGRWRERERSDGPHRVLRHRGGDRGRIRTGGRGEVTGLLRRRQPHRLRSRPPHRPGDARCLRRRRSTTASSSSAPGTTEIVPALAERWEISPDGREYTFHLREGVKFHTTPTFTPSRDLDADDVVFSFDRQLRADSPWHDYAAGGWPWVGGHVAADPGRDGPEG